MKLKELLKQKNIKWPDGATHAVQDHDGCVKFASSSGVFLTTSIGIWNRSCHAVKGSIAGLQVTSDWNNAIIPRSSVETTNEAHPHADLMLQYAKDAMTTAEPWKLWEYREDTKEWFLCTANPYWFTQSEYRRKPITKLIHGVEVPNISFQPKQGEVYNCPNPISNTLFHTGMFSENSAIDLYRKSKNLCYPYTEEGSDAAILHAKAMLGIK